MPPFRDDDFTGTDRFTIHDRLGAGGMGVVYRAHDRERRADVALKILHAADGEAVLRLKQEFRALRDVSHPNLVSLGELIEDAGRWFFTMELIDGVDFVRHVRGVSAATTGHGEPATTRRGQPGGSGRPVRALGTQPPPTGAIAVADLGRLDEARLRAALVQLGRGLDALHAAGKIHRDVKPSNVLVTRDGRVVLLDFGLVVDDRAARAPQSAVAGTTAYMAPEQAAGAALGPAADWYATGVLLYEALTGELPFSGPPVAMMLHKQDRDPPPPSELASDVPADLDALCMALLRREPRARPGGPEVLARLRAAPSPEVVRSLGPPPLVGRDDELARLWAAFHEAADGAVVAVMVRGESGVGKSYLVRHFLERVAERRPDAVILHGRCYERESVPYKAFDGVADELAGFLAELPGDEAAALLPPWVNKLAALFPVLRRVEAIARAPRPAPTVDPQQLRARAFGALRQLLANLAAHRPVVIAIDDLPWTDPDSLALLRELLRPPGAPPLLLLATLRDVGLASEPTRALALAGRVHDLALAPLAVEAASALVAVLARPVRGLGPREYRALADEARGHPLFIQELVHHAAQGSGEAHASRVDDAIATRVARLDPASRALVELVAVAGRPLPQELLARAAGEPFDDVARRATTLRLVNLIRLEGARRADAIEPYHDRVREAVVASLTRDRARALHERLAQAMEAAPHADAEALAVHWRGAGQPARALAHARRAADQAVASFAFRRAAGLYQLVVELCQHEGLDPREPLTAMAEALANGGLRGEAADVYGRAAAVAPPEQAAELEQRAVSELLRGGFIDEGLAQARTVLARVGVTLPRSPRMAMASLAWQRARVRLRGLEHLERHADDCDPAQLRFIDTCWSMVGLTFANLVVGAAFNAHALRVALAVGEPRRLARHLASEACLLAQQEPPGSTASEQLFARAEALAERGGRADARSFVLMTRGLADFFLGRFALGRARFAASRALSEGQVGMSWETSLARLFDLSCALYLGELAELALAVPPLLAEADDRGDRFSAVSARLAIDYLLSLAAGRPAEARRSTRDSMRQWSQGGFHTQHRLALVAEAEVDLYEGRGRDAERRLRASWPDLERSLLLRARRQRIESHHARGRAALAAAGERGADRAACLATAERSAAVLARDGAGWALAFAELLRAGLAARRGDDALALGRLSSAVRSFDRLGMAMHAATARWRYGELLGGSAGQAQREQAATWFAAAGVVEPDRFTALHAPGLGR